MGWEWHVPCCRYIFGTVSGSNVLTNLQGNAAAITLGRGATSFDLASFYATPVFVDMLQLTLMGVTKAGMKLQATFDILNPQRTLVSHVMGQPTPLRHRLTSMTAQQHTFISLLGDSLHCAIFFSKKMVAAYSGSPCSISSHLIASHLWQSPQSSP